MPALADVVLPMIRSREELWRWERADSHGEQMHAAIDVLEAALPVTDPTEAFAVGQKALASALTVIARADDSSGVIGDACVRLLELHPQLAAAAHVTPAKLVRWMMAFQFESDIDYFALDPVDYADALGDRGMTLYRKHLDRIREGLGSKPDTDTRDDPDSHSRGALEWNERRLAVLDRDVDAIIRTHARDRLHAYWLVETAQAFEEIGDMDRAIEWAQRATELDDGQWVGQAAEYWCTLLSEYRPGDLLAARIVVFRRWPAERTATRLHAVAGTAWPELEAEVTRTLRAQPTEAVRFALGTLKDARAAWQLAHELIVPTDAIWSDVATAYERIDPLAALPVHRRLVDTTLLRSDVRVYPEAARRLVRMRRPAAGTDQEGDVDAFIGELREKYKRRPRMLEEFDRTRLP